MFYGDNLIRLLEGGTLLERNTTLKRPFNEFEAREIIKQVLSALACCHSMKITHRDIKLQNIMFKNASENSQIKLIDFGLAKKIKGKNEVRSLMGTTQFIAPEIFQNNEPTLKSDIYSVGILLYYLIRGSFPFNAYTIEEYKAQVLKHNFGYDKLLELKGFSEDGKTCLRRMLIIDATQRPSAAEMLKHPWFNTNLISPQLNEADKNEIVKNIMKYKDLNLLQKAIFEFIVYNLEVKEEIEKIEKLFKSWDTLGDGALTKDEFYKGLMQIPNFKITYEGADYIFKTLDADHNNKISYTEFLSASLKAQLIVSEENLKNAYTFFDKTHSGFISARDLSVAFKANLACKQMQIDNLIAKFDKDHDHLISYSEFREMIYSLLQ